MRVTDDYVFFWEGIFSQWHPSPFEAPLRVNGLTKYQFNCAEQYMMAHKAVLFGDTKSFDLIMASDSPKEQKKLGRQVQLFNDKIWMQFALDIVTQGSIHKYEQNPELLKALLETEERRLVEASPYDKIWGIGLHYSDDLVLDPINWQGLNLLGKALDEAKNYFSHG